MNTEHLNFGQAIEAVKNGYRAARAGWNGKGMFIFLNNGSYAYSPDKDQPSSIDGVRTSLFDCGDQGTVTRLPNINMRSASGSTVTGWLASQTDMLAEDWAILNEPA